MNPDLYQELVKQINSLQKQVDGLIKPEVSRWVDWTPTVDQGGNVARTIIYAQYVVIGNTVHVLAKLNITAAGTGGNSIVIGGIPTVSQPANFGGATDVLGVGSVSDAGTAQYVGALVAIGAADWRIIAHNQTSYVGATPNFALANGDAIGINATYKIA